MPSPLPGCVIAAGRLEGGAVVREAGALSRIRALAIPPAWTDVWVAGDPRGHIQATGQSVQCYRQPPQSWNSSSPAELQRATASWRCRLVIQQSSYTEQ